MKELLYIILCAISIIFFKLIEYTNTQSYIANTSRCFKQANLKNYTENVYILKAYTKTNIEIFRIIYDFSNKTYSIKITAPKGDVLNKVTIPVYNIRTRDTEEIERIFYAETEFEQPFKYEGHPELIHFMQYGSTNFFENKFLEDYYITL
jgi:hypothetical protein